MSLSNLSSGFNLSLDGLNVINADIIYVNGQDISQTITGNYVPYSGASSDVNLNGKSINNTNVVNATTLNGTNLYLTSALYTDNINPKTLNGIITFSNNNVRCSFVPSNSADLINLLYLTNNYYTKTNIDTNIYTKTQIDTTLTSYYTKTSTDTLLNAKANLSGATFTGAIDMGAYKITTTYVPVNDADLINKLYLTNNNYTKTQTDNLFNDKANLSGATFTGAVSMGANKITSSYVPVNDADLINKLYLTNNYYTKTNIDTTLTNYYTKTNIDTNIYTKTQSDANYYSKASTDSLLSAKANLSGASFSGNVSTSGTFIGKASIRTLDLRNVKPSDLGAGYITFHFGSYNNNGGGDYLWSDCIHFNSYIDGSGGSQNLLMLRKDAINLRIYQGGFGSTTAYSTYKDALLIDSSNNINSAINMGSNKITATYTPSATSDLTTKTYVDTQDALKASLSGATFTGVVSMGANKITSTYVPVNNEDLINKLYLTNNYYTSSATDTLLNAKATITYVNTQDALKVSKAGDTMSGNLEILTATIPNFLISYSGYAYLPTVDTDVGLLRFHHNRDQNNKFCDIKATVRTGQYMPSVVFATNPTYSASNVNRMIITENGNVGINTMSPSTLLYVNGTTTLNGNTTVGGILDTGANKITSSFSATANTDITNKLFVDTAITTSKTNLLSGVNTWSSGQIFSAGITSNGNVDVGSNRAICNRVPTYNDDLTNKLFIDNSFVTFATYYYNKTTTDSLLNAKANLSGASFSGDVSTPGTFIGHANITMFDQRSLKPSNLGAGYITFGFGTYNNDNGYGPYADFIHFNSYWDSSGGSPNALMLCKSGIGLRIFQGSFGGTTAYTSYKDAVLIDNTNTLNVNTLLTSSALNINTTNTQNTNIGNTTGNTTINNLYLPNIAQSPTVNKRFLTSTPSGKIEYSNYGIGLTTIFEFNLGSISNWSGSLKTTAFSVSNTQYVLFTGHVSGYCTSTAQTVTVKLRFNINGSTTYTYEDIKFYVNASYTHVAIPINLLRAFTTGTYDVYIYVSSGNLTIDINDFCYLNAIILF